MYSTMVNQPQAQNFHSLFLATTLFTFFYCLLHMVQGWGWENSYHPPYLPSMVRVMISLLMIFSPLAPTKTTPLCML